MGNVTNVPEISAGEVPSNVVAETTEQEQLVIEEQIIDIPDNEETNALARKMQAVQRGNQARREVAEKKAAIAAAQAEAEIVQDGDPDRDIQDGDVGGAAPAVSSAPTAEAEEETEKRSQRGGIQLGGGKSSQQDDAKDGGTSKSPSGGGGVKVGNADVGSGSPTGPKTAEKEQADDGGAEMNDFLGS